MGKRMPKTPERKTRKPAAKAKAKAPPARPARKAKASSTVSAGWASGVVFANKEPKLAVSLRLDADVLRFFRGLGSGYQTRINEVLRVFMDAHQASGGSSTGRTRRAR